MSLTVTTTDPDATELLAARVGSLLRPGDVVVLAGELGTGKTVFARGIARALGVRDTVVSPTFTIVREYEAVREHGGALRFVHVDVYRLDRVQELHEIGFDDLIGDDTITVVEWGDRVGVALPPDRLEVSLEADEQRDEVRTVRLAASGRTWLARQDALAAVVGASA